MSAISEVITAPLATKTLNREVRVEAPFSADSEATSLEGKAQLNSAKFTSYSRAKVLSSQITSPRDAKPRGKAVPSLPPAKK